MKTTKTSKDLVVESTSTELVTDSNEAALSDIRLMPTHQIKDEIRVCLKATAENVKKVALCLRVLEERGEPLPDIDEAFLSQLRMVGYDRLIPEAIVEFGNNNAMLNTIRELPISRQRDLMARGTVSVVKQNGRGPKPYVVPLAKLTRCEIAQVFDGPRVRSADEQAALIKSNAEAPRQPDKGRKTASINLYVQPNDYDKLESAARKQEISIGELIRSVLREQGLI